jgi:hypothetical protein
VSEDLIERLWLAQRRGEIEAELAALRQQWEDELLSDDTIAAIARDAYPKWSTFNTKGKRRRRRRLKRALAATQKGRE